MNLVSQSGVNSIDEQGRRKKGDNVIVGGVNSGKEIGLARESIRAGELGARDMPHIEIKIGKVKEPASLAAI